MPIYEFQSGSIVQVTPTSFAAANLRERTDLQRLLREYIEVVSPDSMVIAEEFGEWEDARRRIDLLCVDKNANLVVIELKRTEDGGLMDLQALRYAAMVSTLTFEQAVGVFERYLQRSGKTDARRKLLDFLEWDNPDEEEFAPDVRVVLASADFSKELTTAVLWLNDRDLDIRCIRLTPHLYDGRVLVNVEQIVPIPEAADYQVRVREKVQKERIDRRARWTEAEFMDHLELKHGEDIRKTAQDLINGSHRESTRFGAAAGEIKPG